MRLHRISNGYRLTPIERFNHVALTTATPPLAPRIPRSKHATCEALMTSSSLPETPPQRHTLPIMRSESRSYRFASRHSISTDGSHCTPHPHIQTQQGAWTLLGEHAQPADTLTHSPQHNNQPQCTHNLHKRHDQYTTLTRPNNTATKYKPYSSADNSTQALPQPSKKDSLPLHRPNLISNNQEFSSKY
jgi:hypothetical protein